MTQTFLRLADVCRVTGLPRATIYEMVGEGRFPRQVRLSARAVGWLESEIVEWHFSTSPISTPSAPRRVSPLINVCWFVGSIKFREIPLSYQ
jgi:prophage regulatory protein